MKFEEKLQNLRKASHLSQEQLADKLDVSRQAVSKWESGSTYPEMDNLIAMCKIFKCSLDDLVNDEISDEKIIQKNGKTKADNKYIDSVLEFITKSINMFCSMKFTSVLKCFFELFILGLVLSGILIIVIGILFGITESLTITNGFFAFLVLLILGLIIAVCVSIAFIVFFQFYKIRYLDYYDKLIYEYEQNKELEKNIFKKESKENIKLEDKKTAQIIIRDPAHQPFAFLSLFSKMILCFTKAIVLFFSLFFVATLVFLIIGFVLSFYLLFKNFIFFGILLGILGLVIVNLEILWCTYAFVCSKDYKVKWLFSLFISSVFIASIGTGLSIIELKDFKFVNTDTADAMEKQEYTLKYKENLVITAHGHIEFIEDEAREDIRIEVDYPSEYIKVDLIERPTYYDVEYDYFEDYHRVINNILNDLEKNIIRDYDYIEPSVKVYANKKTVSELIKNLSKKNHIEKQQTDTGYEIVIGDYVQKDEACFLQNDNTYECYGVNASDYCSYKVDENNKVIPTDEKNCYCVYSKRYHEYTCDLKRYPIEIED